jgi:hypothetical protein
MEKKNCPVFIPEKAIQGGAYSDCPNGGNNIKALGFSNPISIIPNGLI